MPRRPILALLTILLAVALLGACGQSPRPNVVIITVDTLRADYLGFYGDSAATTPRLDELAAASTVFDRAAAPMPITRPSHFSMLTGQYPREHGVLNNSTSLPETALTLAEILQPAGYSTAAFVGTRLLGPGSGSAQGFERFRSSGSRRERPARQVVSRALEWLNRLPGDSEFFLWVHLFDPHMPYAPPEEFRPVGAGELTSIQWQQLDAIAAENEGDVPASILEQTQHLYRGEIAYTDSWIGRLLDGIAARFDLDETLVVLTADHGECFENGIYFDHAHCLFEPAMRIPLLVRYPRQFAPGARVSAQVSMIDVAPTVLEAVGLDIGNGLSGRPLQEAADLENRYVLIQHAFYDPELIESFGDTSLGIRTVAGKPVVERVPDLERYGLVGGGWKFMHSRASEELFRIAPETDETLNLVGADPQRRDEMYARLQQLLKRHPPHHLEPTELDEQLREDLEALGYLD